MNGLRETIDRLIFDINVQKLCNLPDWEFCVIMGEGFFSELCAGTTYKGAYYSEQEIYAAYFIKWPDAEPLI